MQRIDDPSNVPTWPAVLTTVSPGYFRRPSVLAGDQGTIVTADFLNDVQENLVLAILDAGVSLSKGTGTKLRDAINAKIATHLSVAASEAVSAHSRFATAAEVLAQSLGTVGISPLRLKQAFPATLANPGSIQIPTLAGNAIVNWGTLTIGSASTSTVTLNRPYASGAFARFATIDNRTTPGSGADVSAWDNVSNPLTQIDVRNATGNSQPVSWLSIGL